MKENKRYRVSFYFWSFDIDVSAKNATEAKRKGYAKLNRRKPSSYVMKKQTGVDEL